MIIYRRFKPVQALSFDLDDTLYNNVPIIKRAVAGQLAYIKDNYSLCRDKSNQFWFQLRGDVLLQQPQLAGKVTALRKRVLALGLEKCGYQAEQIPAAVEDIFQQFYQLRSDFRIAEGVASVLTKLAKKVPLVAMTNGNMDLHRIGLAEFFKFSYFADDYHAKPHSMMYRQASSDLHIEPNSIMHIGDQWRTDVLGARRCGFSSALFTGFNDSAADDTLLLADVRIDKLQELLELV